MKKTEEIIVVIDMANLADSKPFVSIAQVIREYKIPRRKAYLAEFPIQWENLLILKKPLPRALKPGNKPNLKK